MCWYVHFSELVEFLCMVLKTFQDALPHCLAMSNREITSLGILSFCIQGVVTDLTSTVNLPPSLPPSSITEATYPASL